MGNNNSTGDVDKSRRMPPTAEDPSVRTMAVSIGKIEITPAVGLPLGGFGVDSPRLCTGTNAPLYVRCTIYWDDGRPNVIATANVLAFPRSMHRTIRSRVTALGVAESDFILTATLTHNGPALIDELVPYIAYNISEGSAEMTAIQTYSTNLVDQIVQLVSNTLAATRFPCTLDYQCGDVDFSFNREGLPYNEHDVPILVARSTQGKPLAVLFGYGCHPVSAGQQTLTDPDYPGLACSIIENSTGAFAQFILGPAGDQNPLGSHNWSRMDSCGTDLGQTVAKAITTPGRPITGPIYTAYREVTLPLDIAAAPSNLAAARADYVARQSDTSWPHYYHRHAQVMVSQIDAGSFQTSMSLPLQTWKLQGDPLLRLALTGGELVSGFGEHFRNQYGGSNGIWVTGYSGEVPAYIPTNELLQSGGALNYACGWNTDYPDIAGGAMTIYGWLGHFFRPPNTPSTSVEQIVISGLTDML